jgi:hypothetical protein
LGTGILAGNIHDLWLQLQGYASCIIYDKYVAHAHLDAFGFISVKHDASALDFVRNGLVLGTNDHFQTVEQVLAEEDGAWGQGLEHCFVEVQV